MRAGYDMFIMPCCVLQWLRDVRGLRGWLQHVRMPGVTGVEVWSWASDEEEDTVPDGILRQACPQAKVEYNYNTKRIEKWGECDDDVDTINPSTSNDDIKWHMDTINPLTSNNNWKWHLITTLTSNYDFKWHMDTINPFTSNPDI